MAFFHFGNKRIALEQGIALLVNVKLFKTQIRNAVGHVFQLVGGRQRLLLLVKNARQQQASLQDGNLLFDIALSLQSAIQPVFDFNILLHQRAAAFSRLNQALAQLMVNLQLLLHQRIGLDTRRFVWRDRFLRRFFGQRQALAVHRLLQQLKLMLEPVDIRVHVVTLFLQRILQHRVAFQTLTLLFNLRVQQRLLDVQQRLLGRSKRPFPHGNAIQTVTYLL